MEGVMAQCSYFNGAFLAPRPRATPPPTVVDRLPGPHQKEGGRNDPGIYEGQVQNNQRHGSGTFVWADGGRFEGEWAEDRPKCGVMESCSYFDSAAGLYTGQVEGNARTGDGSFAYKNGEV